MSFTGNPQTFNVVCTAKNTEYALAVPTGTNKIVLQARTADCRRAWEKGRVADATAGTYQTIKAAVAPLTIAQSVMPSTIYFASGTDGAVVEVECWS